MHPVLALAAPVLRATADDLDPVVDIDLQEVTQPEQPRLLVDEGDVVDAECVLHRGQPVQLLEHRLGVEPRAHLDHQLQAPVPVGEVLQVRDAGQLLGLDQVLDPGDHLLRPDPVGQLGDHDPGAARGDLLDPRRRPGAEDSPAALVGFPDSVQPHDLAAGRQVGAWDEAHQLVQGRVRVGDQVPGGSNDLAEVVRGHVGGHPDGDPGGPVDEQVRDRGRKHLRLGQRAVVVRHEVDGVLVERGGHLHGGRGQPRLGVAVGGGRVIAAERAEVSVPVDQRQAHRPVLLHPDQRVVDRRVAVRVQAPHDLADDLGTLGVCLLRGQAHLAHLVEDPALHRLEPVPGVGQGALVDHRVGVLEVAGPHLLGDVDVDDVFLEVLGRRSCRGASCHDRHCAFPLGQAGSGARASGGGWRRSAGNS